MALLYCRKGGL